MEEIGVGFAIGLHQALEEGEEDARIKRHRAGYVENGRNPGRTFGALAAIEPQRLATRGDGGARAMRRRSRLSPRRWARLRRERRSRMARAMRIATCSAAGDILRRHQLTKIDLHEIAHARTHEPPFAFMRSLAPRPHHPALPGARRPIRRGPRPPARDAGYARLHSHPGGPRRARARYCANRHRRDRRNGQIPSRSPQHSAFSASRASCGSCASTCVSASSAAAVSEGPRRRPPSRRWAMKPAMRAPGPDARAGENG